MAAKWSIVQLDYEISLDTEDKTVNNIHWECTDKDNAGNAGRTYGSQAIEPDDETLFIPLEAVSEVNAIAWLKLALGADGVSDQEANVAEQIALLKTPVSGSGVPWVV